MMLLPDRLKLELIKQNGLQIQQFSAVSREKLKLFVNTSKNDHAAMLALGASVATILNQICTINIVDTNTLSLPQSRNFVCKSSTYEMSSPWFLPTLVNVIRGGVRG